jgi:hypothetical protein
MPTAICQKCGKNVSYRNKRGFRLADWTCPNVDEAGQRCGGELHAPHKGRSTFTGRQRMACVVCGRFAYHPGALVLPAFEFVIESYGDRNPGPHPAGSPVHHWHHPIPPQTKVAAGLKATLERHGLTVATFAERMRWGEVQVKQMLDGKWRMGLGMVEQLSRALGEPESVFLEMKQD